MDFVLLVLPFLAGVPVVLFGIAVVVSEVGVGESVNSTIISPSIVVGLYRLNRTL